MFAAFFFTSLYRAAGVFLVGWTDNFLNRKVGTSHAPIENKDLTVMALGGLRVSILCFAFKVEAQVFMSGLYQQHFGFGDFYEN